MKHMAWQAACIGGSAHKLLAGSCDPRVRHKSNQIDSKSSHTGSAYSLGILTYVLLMEIYIKLLWE